jgi:hypothetical protein
VTVVTLLLHCCYSVVTVRGACVCVCVCVKYLAAIDFSKVEYNRTAFRYATHLELEILPCVELQQVHMCICTRDCLCICVRLCVSVVIKCNGSVKKV